MQWLQSVDNLHWVERPVGLARLHVHRRHVPRGLYAHNIRPESLAREPRYRHAPAHSRRRCNISKSTSAILFACPSSMIAVS